MTTRVRFAPAPSGSIHVGIGRYGAGCHVETTGGSVDDYGERRAAWPAKGNRSAEYPHRQVWRWGNLEGLKHSPDKVIARGAVRLDLDRRKGFLVGSDCLNCKAIAGGNLRRLKP